MGQSLRTIKGVGEKTEKLFQKVGIWDTDDLIRYYPRTYDAYEAPVNIADLKEGTVQTVSAAVSSGVYVNSVRGNHYRIGQQWQVIHDLVPYALSSQHSEKRQFLCFSGQNSPYSGTIPDGTSGNFYTCCL